MKEEVIREEEKVIEEEVIAEEEKTIKEEKEEEKKEKSKLESLLESACESLDIEKENLNKLNLKKLDYTYRKRKVEKEGGESAYIMDRGFIGLLPEKINIERGIIAGADSPVVIESDSPLTCFIYGKKTIGFALLPDNTIVVNKNLLKSADFICLFYNFMVEKDIKPNQVIYTDILPTGVKIEAEVKSLSDCLNNIKTIENLKDCELGF